MKKKRVSTTSRKKTSKRVSTARRKKISTPKASKKKVLTSTSKKSKSSSVSIKLPASKRAKVSPKLSPRIAKAMKAVTAVSKKPSKLKPVIVKNAIEPLSSALPRVETIIDLPFSYNQTEIVVLPRDPQWAFAYWDFSSETWNWIASFRERDPELKAKLRVHQLDYGTCYDIDVQLEAKNWYLDLGVPNTSFEVELGLLDSNGKFHRIALSNRFKTPRLGPSDKIDPQWELSDFERQHLYNLESGTRGMADLSSSIFSSLKRTK